MYPSRTNSISKSATAAAVNVSSHHRKEQQQEEIRCRIMKLHAAAASSASYASGIALALTRCRITRSIVRRVRILWKGRAVIPLIPGTSPYFTTRINIIIRLYIPSNYFYTYWLCICACIYKRILYRMYRQGAMYKYKYTCIQYVVGCMCVID